MLVFVAGLVRERARIDLVALGRAHETALRQDDGRGLVGDELGFVDGLRGLALDDLRAAIVAVLLGVRFDFAGDELLELRLRLEDALELFAFLGELLLLVADLHFLELGEVAQLGLENRLGLDLGELEALHEHGLGLVLAPDDADHLVEIQIRRQQAIEDVQALGDLVEPELQPARHGGGAERQPLVEQVAQAHAPSACPRA